MKMKKVGKKKIRDGRKNFIIKVGPKVSSEAIVHQKLLTKTLRKMCFRRRHQNLNFRS